MQASDSGADERAVHCATLSLSAAWESDTLLRDGAGLTRRYLPPGQLNHLWWQYLAFAKASNAQVASRSTFYRVAWFVFKKMKALGFRKKDGDHAKCTACEGYTNELKAAKTIAIRQSVMDDYMKHLMEQWMDRQAYWRCRELSRK